MKKRFTSLRNKLPGLIIAAVVGIVVLGSQSMALPLKADSTATESAGGPQLDRRVNSPSANSVFLPVIYNNYPLQTVFGVQMEGATVGAGLNQVAQIPAYWVRGPSIAWSDIEPTPGARNWGAMASLEPQLRNPTKSAARDLNALTTTEQELENISTNGMVAILTVHGTPGWAQQVPGKACGPIKPEAMAAFGIFMRDLVARYSVSPYNVRYWEIWNEPDIDPGLVSGDSPFGCWGNASDLYYGGGYYASALKAVYPQIKAADPRAQVLVGGLLLDCDPGPNGGCSDETHRRPARFLEGILRNGGGPYFDGVSFHAYDFYSGPAQYWSPNWKSAWNTTGPVINAKAGYLKQLLVNYGASGKYLMNTESALLCDTGCDSYFETTKAFYLAEAYAAAIANGLKANLWYSVLGWRNSGLLEGDLSAKPAYTALQVSRSKLVDATFAGSLTSAQLNGSGVRGYSFVRTGRRIWVVWSSDGIAHTITPNLGAPWAVTDALGNGIAPDASISVGTNPLYLEWGL